MTADAADARHRVSRAVWDTVAELGIEATTVRAVAARADCTTGLIMHRFGSRSAMLVHARETLFERTAARADGVDAARDATPAQHLLAVVSSVLPLDEERTVETRIFIGFAAASIADAELRAVHVRNTRQWLTRITGLVADLHPHITVTDAGDHAREIVTAVEGVAVLAALDSTMYPPATQEQLVRRTVADVVDRISA
ncbi:TetR/AcrR family transcriptional regulator [Williamsia sp.]|uniref:TetR/AcrR family transcriptional regulator n=1 Tax=Williamsia sp. TaxID=1872085 RepID=UPI001A2B8969|nr:TetR family transcriptional regulator C-terminal domain-containing protein [Williamsia sp.]MBJ7289216.1 TetR family transcriptional regulator C-terminal domain-containing protein [Williamsia sp.]